jgi:uncharacterized iron-regulated membrane protein
MLRRLLFWLHLAAGVSAGAVILIMSLTGVLLTYEKQILAWADREFRSAQAPENAARLPLRDLVEKAKEAGNGETAPTTITFYAGNRFVAAAMSNGNVAGGGRGATSTRFVDAYSGSVHSPASDGLRGFFRTVTNWHRALAAPDGYREVGTAITGASNLLFVFIVLSGLFIWWPGRQRNLRQVTWFRGGLRGKARDWNWHNVFGFWTAVPLFLIALSGTVISYSWASNLVYRVTGTEPPAQGGERRAGEQRADAAAPRGASGGVRAPAAEAAVSAEAGGKRRRGEEGITAETPRRERRGAGRSEGESASRDRGETQPMAITELAAAIENLDPLLARVESEVPGWKTIALRLPNSAAAPVVFTVDQGNAGQPQYRSTLTLDRAGAIAKHETFADQNAGRQARSWLRYVHTGEYYGAFGQTIAGVASFAGVLLVWTGLSLAFRRFIAWARPRRERETAVALTVPPQTAAEER